MFFLKMLLLLYWLPCTKTGFLYSIWYSTFFDGIHCFVSVLLIIKDQVTCRIIIKNFFLLQTNILKTIAFMLLWRSQYQHLGYLMQCPTWSYQIQKCTNILSLTQSPINNWSFFFSNRRKILIPVYCYIKKIIFLKKIKCWYKLPL